MTNGRPVHCMPVAARVSFGMPLLLLLAACGGPGPGKLDSDDTSAEDSSPAVPPAAHPLCDGNTGPDFPTDLGEFCPMGSNLPLCVKADSDDCSTNLCLWDSADAAGVKAYCTVQCRVDDSSTCPDGYTCEREGCDDLQVCVRTSIVEDPVVYTTESVGFEADSSVSYWVATTDTTATWMLSDGQVRQVASDGTVTEPGSIGGMNHVTAVTDGDAEILFAGGGSDINVLARVADGNVVTRELEDGLSIDGGLRTADGAWYYLAYDLFDNAHGFHAFDPVTLEDLGEPVVPASLGVDAAYALTDHGFVASCKDGEEDALCVGDSPEDVRILPLPPGAVEPHWMTGIAMRRAPDPDHLWWVDEDVIAWWSDGDWIVEDQLGAYDEASAVVPLGDGRAILFADSPSRVFDAVYLDGTCWQPLNPGGLTASTLLYTGNRDETLGLLRPDTVAWASDDGDLLSISVSDFP